MSTHRHWIALTLLLCISTANSTEKLAPQTLKICGDNAGWPPYTYEMNGQVLGYDIDVLNHILPPANIEFTVTMLPWTRCLHLTQLGHYHIALSASFNEERARNYLMTEPYYTVQPSYIYSSKRFPEGLNITQPKDLLNYKVCGLQGYNYNTFGIPSTLVDRETRTFGQVVQKTLVARCDLFLARYEVLAGFAQLGENHLRDGLIAVAIPTIAPESFYMLISRAHPQADELRTHLNEQLSGMAHDGRLTELLDRYIQQSAP